MKTVLITGASRGIGEAIAKTFAKNDYNVIINYYKSENLAEKIVEELKNNNCNAMMVKADISNAIEVSDMFQKIHKKFKTIDVLVNNSGVAMTKLFTDLTEEDWDRTFDVNVKGTFNVTKLALKDMIDRKSGVIINISSMWGEVGASMEVCYSSSKSAIIGLTKALAKEVGLSNIRVNCIAPGLIDTDMNKDLNLEDKNALIDETPIGRIGKAEDIAELVLFLASDKASFITGQIIGVNGGFII